MSDDCLGESLIGLQSGVVVVDVVVVEFVDAASKCFDDGFVFRR
jgi:hypothetical protein